MAVRGIKLVKLWHISHEIGITSCVGLLKLYSIVSVSKLEPRGDCFDDKQ